MDAAPDSFWRAAEGGVLLDVRVMPKGGRDSIDGVVRLADGRAVLRARVRAAPSDGEANAAVLRLLATALGVPARDVILTGGAAARMKRIRVVGDPTSLRARIEMLAQPPARS